MIKATKSEIYNLPDSKVEVRMQFEITSMGPDIEKQLEQRIVDECFKKLESHFDPDNYSTSARGWHQVFEKAVDKMAQKIVLEKYQDIISQIDAKALVNATLINTASRMGKVATNV